MCMCVCVCVRILEAVESQNSHPSEVSRRVLSLKPNLLPLLGVPGLQLCPRHQQLPHLQQSLLMLLQTQTPEFAPPLQSCHKFSNV